MLSSEPETIHCKQENRVNKVCPTCYSRLSCHLATSNGEVGEDAVFFVLVAGVGFQAFALDIVHNRCKTIRVF